MALEVISRKEAIAQGQKWYFSGLPCRLGHIARRGISNRECRECARLRWKDESLKLKSKEYKARFRAANKEKLRTEFKQWYDKNVHHNRLRAKKWAASNKERKAANLRSWKELNYEKVLADNRRRSAKSRGADGTHTDADLAEILVDQKNYCAYCKVKFDAKIRPTLDHIKPIIRGGSNYRSNLQFICSQCNCSKKDRDPLIFAREKGMLL